MSSTLGRRMGLLVVFAGWALASAMSASTPGDPGPVPVARTAVVARRCEARAVRPGHLWCDVEVAGSPSPLWRVVLRLSAPAGLIVAFACLWLPFLVGGPRPTGPIATPVGPSITYTGMDLVFGGPADVRVVMMGPDGRSYEEVRISDEQMYGHPQPPLPWSLYGVVAVSLIGAGILASLIRVARVRATVVAAAALLGALALLALELAQRREVARLVQPLLGEIIGIPPNGRVPLQLVSVRWSFWLAMALLVVIGLAQVAAAVPARRRLTVQKGQLDRVS